MKKSEECKIVKDLLPNYLEDLTDSITNEFIEKHIENCNDCEQILKDMKGEIQLNRIQNNKKINALKKAKKIYVLKFILILFLVIGIVISVVYFLSNYSIKKNERNKYEIVKTTPDFKINNCTYVVLKGYIDDKLKADITYIATINEKNVCVNIRQISQEYSEEFAKEVYDRLIRANFESVTNVKLQEGRIYQNLNLYNGKTKDELIETFKNSFKNVTIQEL